MEPSPQPSSRSGLPPSRAATAGGLRNAAEAPSRAPSAAAPKRRGESPRGGASARSQAPSEAASEAQDSPDANGYVRGRRPRAPPPTPVAGNGGQPKPFFECGMDQPAFKAILDWWESAAVVLGVTAGTVTQGEVEERLERASGMSAGRGSLAEPLEREAREAREARDAARRGTAVGGSPPDTAASGQRGGRSRRLSNERVDRDKDGPAEERDGGGIPGLDFVYRILAPRELMERYERLEQEVESHVFKSYSQEEQEAVRKLLSETQAAIEQRENRLNILAAAVGGLHGAYVGTMAAMLAIFVPQRCPPTALSPSYHTCNLYENTHDLSLLNQAVLAFNGMTLIMMLLTELSVFRREKWLDTTLSYNPRKAARFLSMPSPEDGRSMLEKHPYIAHQLLWQNLTAGNLARATIALVLVNLIISSILIVGFYNDGARSVITIITNTMLLGAKLLWAAVICLQARALGCSIAPQCIALVYCADAPPAVSRRARTTSRACHYIRRCESTSTSSTPTSWRAKVRFPSCLLPLRFCSLLCRCRIRPLQRQVHMGASARGVQARGAVGAGRLEDDGVAGKARDQAHRGGSANYHRAE